MKEYIERETALQILEKSLQFSKESLLAGEFQYGCIAAIRDDIGNIKHLPAADVAPVRHGQWIHITDLPYDAVTCECSRCTNYTSFSKDRPSNFCPTCGADMTEVKDSE